MQSIQRVFLAYLENAVLKLVSEHVGGFQYFVFCAEDDGTISSKPIDLSSGVGNLVQRAAFSLAKDGEHYFAFSEATISLLPGIRRVRTNLSVVELSVFEFISIPSLNGRESITPNSSSSLKRLALSGEIAIVTIVGTFPLNFSTAIFSLRANFSNRNLVDIGNAWKKNAEEYLICKRKFGSNIVYAEPKIKAVITSDKENIMTAPASETAVQLELLNAKVAALTNEIQYLAATVAALSSITQDVPNLLDLPITEASKRIEKILGPDATVEQRAKACSIFEQLQRRAQQNMRSPENLR